MNTAITVTGILVGAWLVSTLFNILVDYIYFPKNKKDDKRRG